VEPSFYPNALSTGQFLIVIPSPPDQREVPSGGNLRNLDALRIQDFDQSRNDKQSII